MYISDEEIAHNLQLLAKDIRANFPAEIEFFIIFKRGETLRFAGTIKRWELKELFRKCVNALEQVGSRIIKPN